MAMDLAHGPISIAGGVVFGILGGILVGSTKLWSTPVARTLATLVMSQLLMFCAVRLGSDLSLCLQHGYAPASPGGSCSHNLVFCVW